MNVTRPGRFDPTRTESSHNMHMDGMGRSGGMPPNGPPPYGYGGPPMRGGQGPPPMGPPPSYGMGRGGPPPPQYGGPPPRDWDRGHRGDSRDFRKRPRSRSPEPRYGGGGGRRR